MDDMDPDGSSDQQPPSQNFIHTLTAIRPSDASALASSKAPRSN
jgi:hypothetical protein